MVFELRLRVKRRSTAEPRADRYAPQFTLLEPQAATREQVGDDVSTSGGAEGRLPQTRKINELENAVSACVERLCSIVS